MDLVHYNCFEVCAPPSVPQRCTPDLSLSLRELVFGGRGTLRELVFVSCAADNKVLLVKEGAHEAIVAAMRAHPQEAAVQEKACGALWNLAVNGTWHAWDTRTQTRTDTQTNIHTTIH